MNRLRSWLTYWPHVASLAFLGTMMGLSNAMYTPAPQAEAPVVRGVVELWRLDADIFAVDEQSTLAPQDPCWFVSQEHDRTGRVAAPLRRKPISFALSFNGEVSAYPVIATSVMPGDTIEIEALMADSTARFIAGCAAGRIVPLENDRWQWIAPDSTGSYCVSITNEASGETICITTFVKRPYDGGEYLNGYRIGHYLQHSTGDPSYARPAGMIEVWPEDLTRWVSPHFQLGQFLCKQADGWPKYLVLQTRLLLKLEKIIEELATRGIYTSSFYVTSGYRTPYYNALIGNATRFSRHTYGDAADIFLDRNRNLVMDDVNGNGIADGDDALYLYRLVDNLSASASFGPFIGGLGFYPPNSVRGSFIHVDTRGRRARWVGTEPDDTTEVDSTAILDSLKALSARDSLSRIKGGTTDTRIPDSAAAPVDSAAARRARIRDGARARRPVAPVDDTIKRSDKTDVDPTAPKPPADTAGKARIR